MNLSAVSCHSVNILPPTNKLVTTSMFSSTPGLHGSSFFNEVGSSKKMFNEFTTYHYCSYHTTASTDREFLMRLHSSNFSVREPTPFPSLTSSGSQWALGFHQKHCRMGAFAFHPPTSSYWSTLLTLVTLKQQNVTLWRQIVDFFHKVSCSCLKSPATLLLVVLRF